VEVQIQVELLEFHLNVRETAGYANASGEGQQICEGLEPPSVLLGVLGIHDAIEEGDAELDAMHRALKDSDELPQLPARQEKSV